MIIYSVLIIVQNLLTATLGRNSFSVHIVVDISIQLLLIAHLCKYIFQQEQSSTVLVYDETAIEEESIGPERSDQAPNSEEESIEPERSDQAPDSEEESIEPERSDQAPDSEEESIEPERSDRGQQTLNLEQESRSSLRGIEGDLALIGYKPLPVMHYVSNRGK